MYAGSVTCRRVCCRRTAELVPVEFLVRIGLKATLEKVRAAEASSECPNVDVVYRVERAIRGFDKTINVLVDVQSAYGRDR